MINIIRVGRERLREAYEIVNKVDQGMNVPEWFVAEPYEEFDFWMNEERGILYLAVDEDENVGAMFFVILPGLHPDNLGYDLRYGRRAAETMCNDGYSGGTAGVSRASFTI